MNFYTQELGFGNFMNRSFESPDSMVQKNTYSIGFGGNDQQGIHPSLGVPPPLPPRNTYSPLTRGDNDADFNLIREELRRTGRLFEDRTFPADNSSLFPSKSFDGQVIWKRPQEIVPNPKFFIDGASRFDVKQGELGDCWLLAAVSNLTLHPKLFDNIVRPGQTFGPDYCGLFHFRFWWFGEWTDVVVDDRLPTINGKLAFMFSANGEEFWSALLEKAYAKLHGSYEELSGGRPSNAMDDFTGGVSEYFDLRNPPTDLFDILLKGFQRGSLIACATAPNPKVHQERCPNGIIKGHAYSITSVTICKTKNSKGKKVITPLLRIRNPWGNEAEWNGAWSDNSPEWRNVSEKERRKLGLTFEHDGEFWIEYEDFLGNFSSVEMTNVHLESLLEEEDTHIKHSWEVKTFKGFWVRGVNAGGCKNFPSTFWTNPKFFVTLREEDDGDKDKKCTMIVALLQRPKQQPQFAEKTQLFSIGFEVHSVPPSIASEASLNIAALGATPEIKGLNSYVNLRQISQRYHLPPGTYCIIPSTFHPDQEAEFILRLFCEKPYIVKQNDNPVGFSAQDSKVLHSKRPTPPHQEADEKMRGVFEKTAGADGQVDWKELQKLLNKRFAKEFSKASFSPSTCRSMVAMMDSDKTGKLSWDEFIHLWDTITTWKKTFQNHDKDGTGKLTGFEFRDALLTSGFEVTNKLFATLTTIYSDESKQVAFDDFVLCAIRMNKISKIFQDKDVAKSNSVTFSLPELMEQAMCI